MKVIAIIGGLGSQMLKYAFYLSIKEFSEDSDCYINTLDYYKFKMWNGYELKRIFNIDAPDIQDIFSKEELNDILKSKYSSRTFILNKMLNVDGKQTYLYDRGVKKEWEYKKIYKNTSATKIDRFFNVSKSLSNKIHMIITPNSFRNKFSCQDIYPDDYLSNGENAYYDEFNHISDKYIKGIRNRVLETFKFPGFLDERNIVISEIISNNNSVSIHIRRSDHLYDNGYLFNNSYYKKCVEYIKSKTNNPVFFIFSDEPKWCKENIDTLGLNFENDEIHIIDWNIGTESFRDMQLMTLCKNNILAISSFSWWGYYLSSCNDKIVCAPEGYWLEVENHF